MFSPFICASDYLVAFGYSLWGQVGTRWLTVKQRWLIKLFQFCVCFYNIGLIRHLLQLKIVKLRLPRGATFTFVPSVRSPPANVTHASSRSATHASSRSAPHACSQSAPHAPASWSPWPSHAAASAPLDLRWPSPAVSPLVMRTPVAAPPTASRCEPVGHAHAGGRAPRRNAPRREPAGRAPGREPPWARPSPQHPRREPPRARWPRARRWPRPPPQARSRSGCAGVAASPLAACTPVTAPRAPRWCPRSLMPSLPMRPSISP